MTTERSETIGDRLYRTALMGVATGGLGGMLDHVTHAAPGTDVTGMGGHLVEDGSILHHGPSSDGTLLDRPSGGYLAHASTQAGVGVEADGMGISSIARSINEAGTLQMDGHTIQVLDYVPGGDMVQAVAGHADPAQMMMGLAKMGIEQEMGAHEAGNRDHAARSGDMERDATASFHGIAGGGGGASAARPRSAASEWGGRSGRAGPGEIHGGGANGHAPDADENARDLEELALEHKRDLDTAVETSDVSHVHTEIHAHGRTLSIDTDYEARVPDHDHERKEAAEHVDAVTHSPVGDVQHDEPGIHFRSQVASHLDAMSRDEGMSM